MAGRTVVLIPSNGANIIQSGQVFPSTFIQASGAEIQGIQYEGQQPGISHNAPQQIPQKSALEKFLNVETKTLGAIQIMIGLMHIGLGAISLCLATYDYVPVAGFGCYPFWGGVFFIASGSLCVATVKSLNRCLLRSSVGINVTSAVMASIGIILLIAELAVNRRAPYSYNPEYLHEIEFQKSVGNGIAALLLFFSLLEFYITVSTAHFGCQATCCNSDLDSMVFVPYQISGNMAGSAENNLPAPPEYETVDFGSKAL